LRASLAVVKSSLIIVAPPFRAAAQSVGLPGKRR
jgi:hypothetical protein